MAGSLVESALRDGASAVKLIETLRREGGGYVRLPLHLARLERSARRLGWGCDPDQVQAALDSVTGDVRVRLTLDAAGVVAVQTAALPKPVAEWQIGLAAARLSSRARVPNSSPGARSARATRRSSCTSLARAR